MTGNFVLEETTEKSTECETSCPFGQEMCPCPDNDPSCDPCTGCVNSDLVCNNVLDSVCPGNIDESPRADCDCGSNEFLCMDFLCIDQDDLCNGRSHCSDGSDESEETCPDHCGPIDPPTNGNIVETLLAKYPPGTVLTFTCDGSFTLIGNKEIQCVGGSFDGDVPICEGDCNGDVFADLEFTRIVSGSVNASSRSEIVFGCIDNYILTNAGENNTVTFTCNDTVWEFDELPICQSIGCMDVECHANSHCELQDNIPECVCDTHFTMSNGTCIDVDECIENLHNCPPGTVCVNTFGLFTCQIENILFPYGPSVKDEMIVNRTFPPLIIPTFPIPVASLRQPQIMVTDSGLIYFLNTTLPPYETPHNLSSQDCPKAAVFWDEVAADVGVVYYQEYATPSNTLTMINDRLLKYNENANDNNFNASYALVVTWEVGQPGITDPTSQNLTNLFQVVIVTNFVYTYLIYLYQPGMFRWDLDSLSSLDVVIGHATGTRDYYQIKANMTFTASQLYHLDMYIGNSGQKGIWVFEFGNVGTEFQDARDICYDKYRSEPPDIVDTLTADLSNRCPCEIHIRDSYITPCRFSLSRSDLGQLSYDDQLYAPTNLQCRARLVLRGGPGSHCYYDESGYLVDEFIGLWEVSVYQLYGFFGTEIPRSNTKEDWFENDLLFRYYCCVASNNTEYCDLYLKRRPLQSCDANPPQPPTTGKAFGDPHFSTFDGLVYSFSAVGEFTLLKAVLFSLEVQGRMEVYHSTNLPKNQSRATIFTALAVQYKTFNVEIHLSDDRKSMLMFVDDEEVDVYSLKHSEQPFFMKGDSFVALWRQTVNDEDIFTLYFDDFFFVVDVRLFENSLYFLFYPSEELIGSTAGLLGTYTNDIEDDLHFPDGKLLEMKSTKDITDALVHPVGESWRTTPATSLFTYRNGKNWFRYNDETFIPTFYENLITDADYQKHERSLKQLCKGYTNCMYDAYLTKNKQLGVATSYIASIAEEYRENKFPRKAKKLYLNVNNLNTHRKE